VAVATAVASGALLAGGMSAAAMAMAQCDVVPGATARDCPGVPSSKSSGPQVGSVTPPTVAAMQGKERELAELAHVSSNASDAESRAQNVYQEALVQAAKFKNTYVGPLASEQQKKVDDAMADWKAKQALTRVTFDAVEKAATEYMKLWNADPRRKAIADAARGLSPNGTKAEPKAKKESEKDAHSSSVPESRQEQTSAPVPSVAPDGEG
jgi:hypothetical protein